MATSQLLDTQNTYGADGTELREALGPQHQIQLESTGAFVEAREHAVTTYDEGKPAGGEYHLPTTQTVAARVAGSSTDTEIRTTKTTYDWKLRQPTAAIVDPAGLNLITRMSYDQTTGQLIERRLPKANSTGTDAHTTKTTYWSPIGSGECAGRPEWANLPCKTAPGGQPGGSAGPLPTTSYDEYNIWNQVTSARDHFGPLDIPARVSTTSYDAAGRPTGSALNGGQGTAVPATTTSYSSTTGRPASVSSSAGTISRGYDAIGRQTSYTDADGVTSATTYDILGRPTATSDGKGTTAIAYDATTGRPNVLQDSGAGISSAAYDADGNVVGEWLPNQGYVGTAYDSVGEPTSRSYFRTSCTPACPVMSSNAARSVHGQVTWDATLTAGTTWLSNQVIAYDAAGRLKGTWESLSGQCTGHEYTYDADSNRTKLRTIPPLAGGGCNTTPGAGQEVNHTYDAADRITDSGYSYDNFGRTTSVPAADAGGTQLSATYFPDDRVRTLTQGSTTRTFSMDPANRVRLRATNGQPDEIYHYADDSDSPAWVAKQNANNDWERYTSTLGGSLSAIQRGHGSTTDSVTFQMTNIHGDVMGEVDSGWNLTQSFSADEFGVPQGALPSSGYSWLGGKERRSQFASGVITMGARVYVPQLGRFLQTDPVTDGSANDYDYVNQDPLNLLDLDGTRARSRGKSRSRIHTRISIPNPIEKAKEGARAVWEGAKKAGGAVWKGIRSIGQGISAWGRAKATLCVAGAGRAVAALGAAYVPWQVKAATAAGGCLAGIRGF